MENTELLSQFLYFWSKNKSVNTVCVVYRQIPWHKYSIAYIANFKSNYVCKKYCLYVTVSNSLNSEQRVQMKSNGQQISALDKKSQKTPERILANILGPQRTYQWICESSLKLSLCFLGLLFLDYLWSTTRS